MCLVNSCKHLASERRHISDPAATLNHDMSSREGNASDLFWEAVCGEISRRGWGGLDDQGLAVVASSLASAGASLSPGMVRGILSAVHPHYRPRLARLVHTELVHL